MMLILLDIDGVLVPANSWRKPEFLPDGFPVFSSKSVAALQKIIVKTNAEIVLTTSHKSKYSLQKWHEIFKARGVNVYVIDRLNTDSITSNRKDEILNWYRLNDHLNECFVIIDDDKLLNGLPNSLKSKLVLTSSSVGLTDHDADDAIAILNQSAITYAL